MKKSKEQLLEEIEELLSYGMEKPDISPSLMEYLDEKTLESIRDRLAKNCNSLKEEDRIWLQRFRKEES